MNEIRDSLAKIPKTRKIVSVSIMFGSIFGVFFVGSYFNLFGAKIDFVQKPSTFLFFGFMLTGLFGIFYLFQPIKNAFKSIAIVAALFFAAALFGKFIRGEL
jgi:hypothetical protein